MHILIVDDNTNLARITAMALGAMGCQASTAVDSASATTALATRKVDAVLLDISLGGENGWEFLSVLTAQPGQPPVVMFTCQAKAEIAEEANRRGAFGCLIKPYTLADLRELLEQLVSYRSLHRPGLHPSPSNSPRPRVSA